MHALVGPDYSGGPHNTVPEEHKRTLRTSRPVDNVIREKRLRLRLERRLLVPAHSRSCKRPDRHPRV